MTPENAQTPAQRVSATEESASAKLAADEHCPSKVNLGERGIDAHCQLRPGHVGLHGQDNITWTDIDQSGHGEVYVDTWPVPNVVRELLDLPSAKRPGEGS